MWKDTINNYSTFFFYTCKQIVIRLNDVLFAADKADKAFFRGKLHQDGKKLNKRVFNFQYTTEHLEFSALIT